MKFKRREQGHNLPTLQGSQDYPGKSRGFYPEPRDFLAKSRDFESIYVVIDILLNAIEAKCMNNLLQKKSFKTCLNIDFND